MPTRILNAAGRRIAYGIARGVDEVFASTLLSPGATTRRGSTAESLDHAARLRGLAVVQTFYNQAHHADPSGPFFARPSAVSPRVRRRKGRRAEILDLSWPSTFEPMWSLDEAIATILGTDASDEARAFVATELDRIGIDRGRTLREKYLAVEPNRIAHARWYHHPGELRPCVVLLHGYMSGDYVLEEQMWPLRKLFDGGLDVVFNVAPFHGPRRDPRRGYRPPSFPSSDPRFTIEGLRHLVHDLRALLDYLRAGRVSSVGLMGMSFGGYATALLATLEDQLEFAVMLIPLAAIDRFAHDHGRLTGPLEERAAQAAALAQAQAVVSPLSRPPRLPPERAVVIAGEADRVTGLGHSRLLAEHFRTDVVTFEGGHLLQLGRDRAFEPVWQMFERAGLGSFKARRG